MMALASFASASARSASPAARAAVAQLVVALCLHGQDQSLTRPKRSQRLGIQVGRARLVERVRHDEGVERPGGCLCLSLSQEFRRAALGLSRRHCRRRPHGRRTNGAGCPGSVAIGRPAFEWRDRDHAHIVAACRRRSRNGWRRCASPRVARHSVLPRRSAHSPCTPLDARRSGSLDGGAPVPVVGALVD